MAQHKILLTLVVVSCISFCEPWAVNFYDNKDFTGLAIGLAGEEDECVPVPPLFHGASIEPRGFCVNMYESTDCTGQRYSFARSNDRGRDLTKITKNKFQSAAFCNTEY